MEEYNRFDLKNKYRSKKPTLGIIVQKLNGDLFFRYGSIKVTPSRAADDCVREAGTKIVRAYYGVNFDAFLNAQDLAKSNNGNGVLERIDNLLLI